VPGEVADVVVKYQLQDNFNKIIDLRRYDNQYTASQPGGLQIQYPWLYPW